MAVEPIPVEKLSGQAFVDAITSHKTREYWEKVRADILNERQSPGRIHVTSDNNLAVALLHLGQTTEAISILEKMERSAPNQYYVAANLGTAYELNGENEKALDWIKKAIERNPDAHDGTEWLHVKILEAKIGMLKEPGWLEKHSVLGVDLGPNKHSGNLFFTDHTGRDRYSLQIEKALVYQLHERLEFTPKPDAVVADLLFDCAAIFSLTRSKSYSTPILELARSFDPNHEKIVTARRGPPAAPDYSYYFVFIGAAALVIVGMIFVLTWRKGL